MVEVKDLRPGDYIRAVWLDSGWYKVLKVGPCYSNPKKTYIAVEGQGSFNIYSYEKVERQ